MNAEISRLEELFQGALEAPPGGAREHFLLTECAGNAALRNRVETLIAAHLNAGSFLDPSAARHISTPGTRAVGGPLGLGIVGVRVLEPVAEGGFSVVYLAEQIKPMRRPVALKILKPGLDIRMGNRRFAAEREALAALDHPNIVRVYEAGCTADGRPYLLLEWIRGPMVTCYADAARLTLRERLSLFLKICAGIAHAHGWKVIHQDIKPANILVPEYDGAAIPKIIDFGTAVFSGAPVEPGFKEAERGGFVGTPTYMSPEQATGTAGGVDVRTDVFSLGAVLYELLTGLGPFETMIRLHLDPDLVRHAIQSRRFIKPSMCVEQCEPTRMMPLAAQRQKSPFDLAAALRGDLDAILTKALDADRANRYGLTNDLAHDIRLHLENRPVLVAKPNWLVRSRKFARRHVVPLTTAAVVSGILLVAFCTTLTQGLRSRMLKREVIQRETVAIEAKKQTKEIYTQQLVSLGLDAIRHENAGEAMAWFSMAARLAVPGSQERQLHQQRVHALAASVALPIRVLQHDGPLRLLEFSPDGSHLLALAVDGRCILWDWQADQVLGWSEALGPVTAAEWSRERTQVALGFETGAVEIRNVPTGEVARRLEFGERVGSLKFSPDGGQLAVAGKTLRFWEEPLGEWSAWHWEHPAPVFALRYSADGGHLVSACLDSQARVFSLSRREANASRLLGVFRHETGVTGFTADHCAAALIQTDPLAPLFLGADRHLLSWTGMRKLTAWDPAENRTLGTLEGTCLATRLVPSPTGEWIAVTFPQGAARFWTPDTLLGPATASVKHQERICDLAFGPQGKWVLTASADRTARLWQLPEATPMLSPLMHSREVAHGTVSPNGKWIGTSQMDGQIRVWRLPRPQDNRQSLAVESSGRWNALAGPGSRQLLLTPRRAEGEAQHAVLFHGDPSHYERLQLKLSGEFVAGAWTPEGDQLAILTRRRGNDPSSFVGRLELRTATALSDPPQTIELPFLPSTVASHPGGGRLVISDSQGGLWQVDLNGPRQLTSWIPQGLVAEGQDRFLVFSASGDSLIHCTAQGRIEVWDAASGRLRFPSDTLSPSPRWITPSPKEPHLLITDLDGTSQVIHLEDGRSLGNLLRHPGGVVAQGFSPDGRWVVTSGHDGCLRIRDWRTGEMICPALIHGDEVFGFDFSANGECLVAACRDGTFHVWETKTGASLLPVESVNEPLFDVRLSADNRWAVLMGTGSTVWLRSLHVFQEAADWSVEELTVLSEATSGLAVDRDPPEILNGADWQDRMTRILTLRPEYFRP